MAIRIEILSATASKVRAAFYYEVPDDFYNPVSVDNSRQPAGNALTPEEVTLLREGRLYEYIREGDPSGRSMAQLQQALETLWDNNKVNAKNEYIAKYDYIGTAWRDGVWS